MKNSHSQNHQMQLELMQLLRTLVVMTVFSGIGYFSFLGISPNFLWPILGCIYFLFASILIRRLERAQLFYIVAFILLLITAVLSFDAALRMIFVGGALTRLSLVWMILIGLGITLFGLLSQFQLIRSQLRASLKHNLQSGRLDLKCGYWNFDMPLHFDQPAEENSKMQRLKRLSQLSPIVTALGFAFARAIEGGWQIVSFGICVYVLGCVVAWGASKYLAIAFQLRDWEKEYKITLKV